MSATTIAAIHSTTDRVVVDLGSGRFRAQPVTVGIESGDRVVVIDSPVGRLGISVCYDLRFPELYRAMLDRGVEVIALPAAFTAITGRAHWETLVRARAIENLAYVIAAGAGAIVGGDQTADAARVDHLDPAEIHQDARRLARQDPLHRSLLLGRESTVRLALLCYELNDLRR